MSGSGVDTGYCQLSPLYLGIGSGLVENHRIRSTIRIVEYYTLNSEGPSDKTKTNLKLVSFMLIKIIIRIYFII
jgi:hypothetical protein